MAKKITDLDQIQQPLDGSEYFEVVQNDTSYRATINDLPVQTPPAPTELINGDSYVTISNNKFRTGVNNKLILSGDETSLYPSTPLGYDSLYTNPHSYLTPEREKISYDFFSAFLEYPNVIPTARSGVIPIVFNNKIYLIFGADGANQRSNTVSISTTGTDWQNYTATGLSGLGVHAVFSFKGKLWAAAGVNTNPAFSQTVYSSSDGLSWQAVGTTGFNSNCTLGSYIVYNGMMLVIGTYSGGSGSPSIYGSYDGVTWQVVGSSPGVYRTGVGIFIYKDRLYYGGGSTPGSFAGSNKLFYTTDLNNWTEVGTDVLPSFNNNTLQNYSTSLIAYNNVLYQFSANCTGNNYLNNFYASYDDGLTWFVIESMPGVYTNRVYYPFIFKGKMFLFDPGIRSIFTPSHYMYGSLSMLDYNGSLLAYITPGMTVIPGLNNVRTITDSTVEAYPNDIILADDTNNPIAVSVSNDIKITITVKKIGNANPVTITPGSGTIDGQSEKVLTTQYETVKIVCDGSNWFIV